MAQEAVLLSGSFGLGHEMMARSCAEPAGGIGVAHPDASTACRCWGRHGAAAERAVRPPGVGVPGLYDGLHFAHLRTGSRLAGLMDRRPAAGWCRRCGPSSTASRPTSCSACSPPAPPRRPSSRRRRRPCAPSCSAPTWPLHRMWVAGGNRPVPGDLGRRGGIGPAVPAAGAGRRSCRRRCGPRSTTLRPRTRPGGAGDPAGGRLRAGHGQRLGIRPAGRRACPRWPPPGCTCWRWPGRRRRWSAGCGELARRRSGSRRSASPTGCRS